MTKPVVLKEWGWKSFRGGGGDRCGNIQIVDNRLNLRSQCRGALMFSAEHAGRVLKRDRRYRRRRETTERRDRFDIGNDPRPPGRIKPRNL